MRRVVAMAALTAATLMAGACVNVQVPNPDALYVAFGDSTTAGPSDRQYHEYVGDKLGVAAGTVANAGQSGETSEEGLIRLQQLIDDQLYPSAQVLLYWESGNDITGFIKTNDPLMLTSPTDDDFILEEELAETLGQTQANIESAVQLARQAGFQVYVATYFFMREDLQECGALPLDFILPAQAQRANDYIAELNRTIRTAAANSGAFVVDVEAYADTLADDSDNYHDCNHLSERGNELVAELFAQQLR